MSEPRKIHIFFMCELCDFQTGDLEKMKKHLITKSHQKREAKEDEDKVAWFCYFGHFSDHVEDN